MKMQQRKAKDQRKELDIGKRVERLEAQVAKFKPNTYDFLTTYIRKLSTQQQQQQKVLGEVEDFLKEQGLVEKFQQWLVAKYPPVDQTQRMVCPSCENRGYIGDGQECPICHPNLNIVEPKKPDQ
jgi:rubrerythrin